MRVVHLSTSDIGGGAARAAYRLHTGLGRLGVDSRMLVLRRQTNDPTVTKLTWSKNVQIRLRRSWRERQIRRDFAHYKSTLPPDFEFFSDDRSEAGYDLVRQIPRCDILNLHWVGGFIDHELLFSHLPENVPIVWRLADMGALTGGCHYDNGCGKYTAACGACPILGSKDEEDLSRQIWTRKHHALESIETGRVHLVGNSRWIAAEARRSSLLGRFASTVIANGLDADDFAPRDKGFARDALGVPRNAKAILFVADSAAIKRKGFAYLAKAIEGLRGRSDLFLLSVGSAAPDVKGVPLLHLGRINQDRLLSIIYSAADVFVIPSLQESFGQTSIEALACGTPVVGFDTGGIPDIVRPGITGYLAPVGDAHELGAAIGRILDDPGAASEMGKNGRRIVEHESTLQAYAQSYLGLYRTLLTNK